MSWNIGFITCFVSRILKGNKKKNKGDSRPTDGGCGGRGGRGGHGGHGGFGRGGIERGRGQKEDKEWIPVTKLGHWGTSCERWKN